MDTGESKGPQSAMAPKTFNESFSYAEGADILAQIGQLLRLRKCKKASGGLRGRKNIFRHV